MANNTTATESPGTSGIGGKFVQITCTLRQHILRIVFFTCNLHVAKLNIQKNNGWQPQYNLLLETVQLSLLFSVC